MKIKRFVFIILILGSPAAGAETLSLDQAVSETLSSNPEIAAARSEAEAAAARIPQAKALEDPEVGVQFYDVPIDTTDVTQGMEINYTIQQKIPFPGKRHTRKKAAAFEARGAEQRARQREFGILNDLKRTYYEIYRIDRSLTVNQELESLLKQFAGSTEEQYAAGRTTAEPALKSQVELAKIQNDTVMLEQERIMHAAHLNSLMGREVHREIALPSTLSLPHLSKTEEEVADLAHEKRPELKATEMMVQGSKSRLTAARESLLPDFSLGFTYAQRPNQIDAWSGTAMINLPVWFWGKNRAEIREAKAEAHAAEAEAHAMQIHTSHEAAQNFSAVKAAEKIVENYERKTLPAVRANLEAARLAYANGKADFMTLIDATRTYRELKMDYYRSQAQLGEAFADLEKLVGTELSKGD